MVAWVDSNEKGEVERMRRRIGVGWGDIKEKRGMVERVGVRELLVFTFYWRNKSVYKR